MLHGHIEGLLQHRIIFRSLVRSWPHHLIRASVLDVWVISSLELLLASIENHRKLQIFISWLWESLRSSRLVVVLPRAWHLKFQALPVKDLVRVETWRSRIKSHFFRGEKFVISCSHLPGPISACNVINTQVNFMLYSLWLQDSHVRVFLVGVDKTSSLGFEETSCSGVLGRVGLRCCWRRLLLWAADVKVFTILHLSWSCCSFSFIIPRAWAVFWLEIASLESLGVRSECSDLNAVGFREPSITCEFQKWFAYWGVNRIWNIDVLPRPRFVRFA